MLIRIGTRGSRLAIAQTKIVIEALQSINPLVETEIVIIKTKGDKFVDISLDKIGDKGVFVTEIEDQLISKKIDLAIHSLKDMPSDIPNQLELVPIMKRQDPVDVLITKHKITHVRELPKNALIGTGSKRRLSQLLLLRPDIRIVPIRGNIETRINKIRTENLDGTILAAAGVNRLGIIGNEDFTILPFTISEMIPAPSQGILGAEYNRDNKLIRELISQLIDETTYLQGMVEREFLKEIQGGCHLPLGAYLEITEDLNKDKHFSNDTINGNNDLIEESMIMHGLYGDIQGSVLAIKQMKCTKDTAMEVARKLAGVLLKEVEK